MTTGARIAIRALTIAATATSALGLLLRVRACTIESP
jgi:hypothetical protein